MSIDTHGERATFAARLNWLRAGVLGANDGIVSTAGIVFGVAGATTDSTALLIAGVAGMVAGALSMAGGEYVSVSSQRDTEVAEIAEQKELLARDPEGQRAALVDHYEHRGLSADLAQQVADELTAHHPLAAHIESRLGISIEHRTSPAQAALASMIAFALGAIIPLLVMVLSPLDARIVTTVAAVLAALTITGWSSARLGEAPVAPAIARNLVVGCLAMGLTYAVGTVVGHGVA